MRMLNLQTLKIEEQKDFLTVTNVIEFDAVESFNLTTPEFYKLIQDVIDDTFFETRENLNVYIRLKGTCEELDFEMLCRFFSARLADKNCKKYIKKRLDVPEDLLEINANKMTILNFINAEPIVKNINLELSDESGLFFTLISQEKKDE